MNKNLLFRFVALLPGFLVYSHTPAWAGEIYPQLNFVKEGKAPETELLPYDRYLIDVEHARVAWARARPSLARHLNFPLLKDRLGLDERDLGFAEGYTNLTTILGETLQPFAHIDKGNGRRWLVFASTFGPLHASTPLVRRWIKTYITYDTLDKNIIRVTLAVEGEKLE